MGAGLTSSNRNAREVFGKRAAYYTTSAAHTDKAVLDRIVELARPNRDAVALDVATGTGHTAFALAPCVKTVIAVDVTPEMLEEARRLQADNGFANIEFRLAGAEDLPFDCERFDIVTCRRAAHHFGDVRVALSEMRRVLKAGGRLVIDDRSVPADDFVDATMNQLDVLHDESHVREYRPSEWQDLLREAGFAVETVDTYTRHRPLSSLTDNVSRENTARINQMIASLNVSQREAMNVVEKDGETYINHWFVMAVGIKA